LLSSAMSRSNDALAGAVLLPYAVLLDSILFQRNPVT
jgi:hypothetical protein